MKKMTDGFWLNGPDWFLMPKSAAAEIDGALFNEDVAALARHLVAFDGHVDGCLYRADRALRDVVAKIRLITFLVQGRMQ